MWLYFISFCCTLRKKDTVLTCCCFHSVIREVWRASVFAKRHPPRQQWNAQQSHPVFTPGGWARHVSTESEPGNSQFLLLMGFMQSGGAKEIGFFQSLQPLCSRSQTTKWGLAGRAATSQTSVACIVCLNVWDAPVVEEVDGCWRHSLAPFLGNREVGNHDQLDHQAQGHPGPLRDGVSGKGEGWRGRRLAVPNGCWHSTGPMLCWHERMDGAWTCD